MFASHPTQSRLGVGYRPTPEGLVAGGLVLIGLAVRYVQFDLGRAFWLDEAWLALALERFDLRTPTRVLIEHQAAPLGFLLLSKLGVTILGSHEWVHRLLPFVSGGLMLVIWYPLLRPVLGVRVALLSLALLVLSAPLIHYSAEFKPYGVDAFVTALVAGTLLRYNDTEDRPLRLVLAVGSIGVLGLLLSFTSSIVLAAAGTTLLFLDGRRQRVSTLVLGVVWALCFLAYYIYFVAPVSADAYLKEYWSSAYAPWALWQRSAWDWYLSTSFKTFSFFFGDLPAGGAAAMFVVGLLVLARSNRPVFLVTAGTAVLTLVASMAGRYPTSERLLVFLLPLFCIAIAAGLDRMLDRAAGGLRAAGAVFAVLLFVPALYAAATFSRYPLPRHNPLPLLEMLAQHAVEGDTVYVEWPLVPVVRYYAPRFELSRLDLRFGENRPRFHLGATAAERWPVYERELLELRGSHRVWVMLDRFIASSAHDEAFFVASLNRLGRPLALQQANRCVLYLYDLAAPAPE